MKNNKKINIFKFEFYFLFNNKKNKNMYSMKLIILLYINLFLQIFKT